MKFCSRILLGLYDHFVFYAGLLWLGIALGLWSPISLILRALLPTDIGRKLGRTFIQQLFRIFLKGLQLSGRFRFDLAALDALRNETSLIIAPNHPSLWDAVLLASRVPDVACVMKDEIISSYFLGSGSRLARYIGNNPLRRMILLALQELQRGGNLLLFPEGTRTVNRPIGPLHGSLALIAQRASAPVQTVFIETDSAFLGKGWPLYRKPPLPMRYRVRLGHRFEPHEFGDDFMAVLTDYFSHELTQLDEGDHAAFPSGPAGPVGPSDTSGSAAPLAPASAAHSTRLAGSASPATEVRAPSADARQLQNIDAE